MPEIKYDSTFAHKDWIDGESIVQAGGEDGFNIRFRGCVEEFVKISTTFGLVNTALKGIQQMRFLVSQPTFSLNANSSSAEIDVDTYDRTTLPPNIDKTYYCVITPITGFNVMHTFLYHPIPGNKVRVTIAFYNPTAAAVSFAYRILSLAEPST